VVDENVRGVVSLTEDFEMKGMIPTEKVHATSCRYISRQLYEKKIVMYFICVENQSVMIDFCFFLISSVNIYLLHQFYMKNSCL
jgi:hypothetical protein